MKFLLSLFVSLVLAFSVFAQPEERKDRIVGKSIAPNVTVTTMDDKTINSKDLRGKLIVYNLWYISCPPCREEIPELNEIVAEYAGKDVVFLALGADDKSSIENYTKKNPFNYQIVPSAGQVMLLSFGEVRDDGSLDVPFPTHIVVNRQGFIELKVKGKKGVKAVREELERQFAGESN